MPMSYRHDKNFIDDNSQEFDLIWGVKKTLCFADLVNPEIAAVQQVVDRFNKFIELISSVSVFL